MKPLLLAIAISIATAVYWWAIFLAAYADVLFAGDRNPSAPPAPDRAQTGHAALVIAGGVAGYAVLALVLRWLAKRR